MSASTHRMPRILLFSVVCIAVGGSSCQLVKSVLHPRAEALPHVSSAPPPVPVTALATPVPTPAPVALPAPPVDPEVAEVLDVLRSRHTALSDREEEQLAALIVAESRRHELETALVMAVMRVESGYYHRAVSQVGARGLMQIMPETGKELAGEQGVPWHGPETLFDPFVNVRLGIAYLKELSDRYQRMDAALAAYNWGPGRIDRRLRRGSGLPKIYVEQVREARERTALGKKATPSRS